MSVLKRVLAGGAAVALAVTGMAVIAPTAANATGAVYGTMSVSPAGPYNGSEIVTITYSTLDSTVSGTTPGNSGGMFIGYCVGSGNPQAGTGACGPFEGGGPFPSPAGPSSTVITGAYYWFGAPTITPAGSVRFQIPTPGAPAGFGDYPGYVCNNTTQCNITINDFAGDGPVQIPITYNEATTTALSAAPPSGASTGDAVDLTATITPSSATGSVEFFDGATSLGTAVVSSGSATISTSFAGGTRSLSAEFTGTGVYGDSSGSLSYTVGAAATSTALSVDNATPDGYAPVTFHADVTAGATTLGSGKGSVTFRDGATPVCSNVPLTATGADCTAAVGFAPNTVRSITAQFNPAVAADYSTSTSSALTVTVGAAAGALPALQNVVVTVAPGALSISTPYNDTTNPFDLGTALMNANGTAIQASATLSAQDGGITVTDTRAGDPGWTASASLADFSGPGAATISGDAVSFSGLSATGDTTPTLSSIAALGGAPEPFATTGAGAGSGTTVIDGTLSLSAPTTTPAGSYTALLTLTVA
jgi:Bacterial Ig-like domain (group 3)